jgi:RNA polymerase sigma-70 factor (ECF subfamily)
VTNGEFEAEFGGLYEPLYRRLMMVVRNREVAADLTQSAFVRAHEFRGRFDGRDAKAWLFQIGIRLALSHLRRDRLWQRARDVLTRRETATLITIDPDLWLAIGNLRPDERAAILLHVIDGYSYKEIADMLSLSTGTVGSHISRGKKRLRQQLGQTHGTKRLAEQTHAP